MGKEPEDLNYQMSWPCGRSSEEKALQVRFRMSVQQSSSQFQILAMGYLKRTVRAHIPPQFRLCRSRITQPEVQNLLYRC